MKKMIRTLHFPGSFMAGLAVSNLLKEHPTMPKALAITMIVFGLLLTAVSFYIELFHRRTPKISGNNTLAS